MPVFDTCHIDTNDDKNYTIINCFNQDFLLLTQVFGVFFFLNIQNKCLKLTVTISLSRINLLMIAHPKHSSTICSEFAIEEERPGRDFSKYPTNIYEHILKLKHLLIYLFIYSMVLVN